MNTLLGTIAVMVVSTALIFGVPMLFEDHTELASRTIAMEYSPQEESGPGGDYPAVEPAPPPWRGLFEAIFEPVIDHVQELFWALVQAFLIARYVKKRR